MYGSQPIVMNNNFVNYNYYINDIRQSNFGSQTQKISTKNRPPGKGENTRKKNQRVKSEINRPRGNTKRGADLSKLSDAEKLKYFEKYKKKFGVNYKAELSKRRNSETVKQSYKEKNVKRRPIKGYTPRDLQISEVDRAKHKIISERDTGKVKSYRKNTNKAKKAKENFIKRNMKLIREAKKKAEKRIPKAMKTGELRTNVGRSKQPRIEHKKSKSQIVSRRNERKRKQLEEKAVIKGKVNMGIIMKRMEKDRMKTDKTIESKISDSKNESFISKGSQNRAFLSRSPINKKMYDHNVAYKTMGEVASKKDIRKKKKKYVLSSMKEKQKSDLAKKRREAMDREKEKEKKEKQNRKDVSKIGNSYLRRDYESRTKLKMKNNKKGLNKSGLIPKSEVLRKKRVGPKSYDPFLNANDKKTSKKAVLFSDLRGSTYNYI